jgi:hypothetical protein
MNMSKWYMFDPLNGSRQKRPPKYRMVLVQCESLDESSAPMIVVGYRKDHAGDKQCPYFVLPGASCAGKVIAWNDCLGDDFKPLLWKMAQPKCLNTNSD